MIRDLSETLRAMLDDEALKEKFKDLLDAQVSFDRPDENFKPSQATVNLFLYDVREDPELRSNESVLTLSNGLAQIRRAPLRVACSYLLTAWPVGGAEPALQEHHLLSQALMVLSRYPKIPDKFLQGELKKQRPENDEAKKKLYPALPMLTAKMEGVKDPHEFWAAIGGKMRASIRVTATIAMEVVEPEKPVAFVTSHTLRTGERLSAEEKKLKPETREEFVLSKGRIGGRVLTAQNEPVSDAEVTLAGTGLTARTDDDGAYIIGAIAAGVYTVRVQKNATVKEVSITVPGINYDVRL